MQYNVDERFNSAKSNVEKDIKNIESLIEKSKQDQNKRNESIISNFSDKIEKIRGELKTWIAEDV